MKADTDRFASLLEALASLLAQEHRAWEMQIASMLESLRVLQGDTADRRVQRLVAQVRDLQGRLALFTSMARRDFLEKIKSEAEELSRARSDDRLHAILAALIDLPTPALNRFCEVLLDQLIAPIGAERGFIIFYHPETTEADVIAARRFQTTHLPLEEYDFSRTLLRRIFEQGAPLLLEDVSHDPVYFREISVKKFQLKSIVAVPLQQQTRTVGAIYLENNSRPCAFTTADLQLVETMARFTIFYLQHARLLPVVFAQSRRVFFDTSKAAKEIIGLAPQMVAVQELIQRIADSPATVLIEGESGTGKELVARALHYQSGRRERPFIAINCAAIPENLLESQLFGHEKGAFTGATERYIGRMEQGNGGTIFLDEVSELTMSMQSKLLRFLESNELERVGGRETIRLDVRIVAATSRDLKAMMAAGTFQEALYYRLNVIPILLPALRERKEDIPLLAEHFVGKYATIYQKNVRLEPAVAESWKDHPFPGNVRELENLIHRLIALATSETISFVDLPKEYSLVASHRVSLAKDPLYRVLHTPPADLDELRRRRLEIRRALDEQERQLIDNAIQEAGGNLSAAASRLGVHRVSLYKMLKKTGENKDG